MKKRALLIVGLALMIAAAGVVYAAWQDTLTKTAIVGTGTVEVEWGRVFTDDDGWNTIGEEPGPIGFIYPAPYPAGSVEPDGEYDYNLGYSSTDPSSGAILGVAPADRYTKDVGDCTAWVNQDPSSMKVEIFNGYPSYHCNVWAEFENTGSVPVMVQSVAVTISRGGQWVNGELDLDIQGAICGMQIDPLPAGQIGGTFLETFHLLQAAQPGLDVYLNPYTVEETITFVNWNEYVPGACAITINGVNQ